LQYKAPLQAEPIGGELGIISDALEVDVIVPKSKARTNLISCFGSFWIIAPGVLHLQKLRGQAVDKSNFPKEKKQKAKETKPVVRRANRKK